MTRPATRAASASRSAGRSTRWLLRARRSTPARPTRATRRAPASPSPTASPGVSFRCQLDGGGFSACSSPAGLQRARPGRRTASRSRRATRPATRAASASYGWTVDTQAPPTPDDRLRPARSEQLDERQLHLLRQRVRRQLPLPARRWRLQRLHARPQGYSGLGQGAHSFQVKARDGLGNESARRKLRLDGRHAGPADARRSTPPRPTRATRRAPASPSPTASPGVSFRCQLDGGGLQRLQLARRATAASRRAATPSR